MTAWSKIKGQDWTTTFMNLCMVWTVRSWYEGSGITAEEVSIWSNHIRRLLARWSIGLLSPLVALHAHDGELAEESDVVLPHPNMRITGATRREGQVKQAGRVSYQNQRRQTPYHSARRIRGVPKLRWPIVPPPSMILSGEATSTFGRITQCSWTTCWGWRVANGVDRRWRLHLLPLLRWGCSLPSVSHLWWKASWWEEGSQGFTFYSATVERSQWQWPQILSELLVIYPCVATKSTW